MKKEEGMRRKGAHRNMEIFTYNYFFAFPL
jgi:hypothetical protein